MVNVQVDLDNEENKIVSRFKVDYGLKTKEEAIKMIIKRDGGRR